MIKRIPLFPLSLVAFPGENLNLHIFEPRYRQLTHDCFENDIPFGVVTIKDKRPLGIGSEMKIEEIENVHSDGSMDIRTKGISVFNLLEFENKMNDKLYPGGKVEVLDYNYDSDMLLKEKLLILRDQLFGIVRIDSKFDFDINTLVSFDIAHKLGLSLEQEINLLKIENEIGRLNFLISHLESVIPSIREVEDMKYKVKMNGHFKNVIPPEFE